MSVFLLSSSSFRYWKCYCCLRLLIGSYSDAVDGCSDRHDRGAGSEQQGFSTLLRANDRIRCANSRSEIIEGDAVSAALVVYAGVFDRYPRFSVPYRAGAAAVGRRLVAAGAVRAGGFGSFSSRNGSPGR